MTEHHICENETGLVFTYFALHEMKVNKIYKILSEFIWPINWSCIELENKHCTDYECLSSPVF